MTAVVEEAAAPAVDCPAIFAAMSAVMADMDNVGKTGTNKEQGYKFRSIEDVLTAAHTALVKHRVFFLPRVISRETETRETRNGAAMNVIHLEIEYTFYAADGSEVSSVVWGEGADMADKSTNKAMSQALKYNLIQALCISAGDVADPDASAMEAGPRRGGHGRGESWEDARPAPPRQPQGQQGQQQRRPPVTVTPLADEDPWKDKIAGVTTPEEGSAVRAEIKELHDKREIDDDRAARLNAVLTARGLELKQATNGNGHHANGHEANGQQANGQNGSTPSPDVASDQPPPRIRPEDQGAPKQSRTTGGTDEDWVADFYARLDTATDDEAADMQRQIGPAITDRKIQPAKAAELTAAVRARRHALQGSQEAGE